MRRIITGLITGLIAGSAALVGLGPAPPASAAESIQLAIDAPFADPTFLAADGHYYAYSTGGDGVGGGFPVASADSMTGPWTTHDTVSLPTQPAWVGQNPQGAYNYWAPSVFRTDAGTYVMYFTANNDATDRRCVGVATADAPLGPFTAEPEPALCHDTGQVIDPSPYQENGQRYLVYKVKVPVANGLLSFRIHAHKMDDTGVHPEGDDRILLEHTGPEEETIEAPDIERHGDHVFLFVARDRFGTCAYRTEAWRADRLWTNKWTLAATLLDEAATGLCGPGGAEIGPVGDETWAVFHAWDPGHTYRRMYVARIGWGDVGPFVI